MEYFLVLRQDLFYDDPFKVEINQEEAEELKHSFMVLKSALAIAEKYELLISNYLELEQESFKVAANNMVKHSYVFDEYSSNRQLISRRVANFLTTATMYLDHVPHNLNDIDSTKGLFDGFTTKRKKIHADNFDYRFCYSLRNYVQHSGLAIDSCSVGVRRTSYDNSSHDEYGAKFVFNKSSAEISKKFKDALLKEMPESINIIKSCRSYLSCLSELNNHTRQLIVANISEAKLSVKKAMLKYNNVIHNESSGLCVFIDSGTHEYTVFTPVYLGIDHLRAKLENGHPDLTSLKNSYVSGGDLSPK